MRPIPKILYTFWTGEMGPVVRHCLERMSRCYRGYEMKVLGDSDLPEEMRTLSPEYKADFARLDALAQTGGVWLDASCIVFDMDWLHSAVTFPDEAEMVGFGAPWDQNVLENWTLAAPHPSSFVAAWRDEYVLALREGPPAYCDRVKSEVPTSLHPSLPYLTCHAAAAVVRRRHHTDAVQLFQSAPQGPFGVQVLFDWDVAASAMYILTQPVARVHAVCGSFCKLRGVERNRVQDFLKKDPGILRPGSVLHESLHNHNHHNPAAWLVVIVVLLVFVACWFRGDSRRS